MRTRTATRPCSESGGGLPRPPAPPVACRHERRRAFAPSPPAIIRGAPQVAGAFCLSNRWEEFVMTSISRSSRSWRATRRALLGGAVLAALGLASAGALAQTATLKFGTFIPPKADEIERGIAPWLDELEKESGGALKFQRFFGGTIERSLLKQHEQLQNGLQDATIIPVPYVFSLFPDFTVFALPYLVESAKEGSILSWRMHQRGLLRGMDTLHVVGTYLNDPLVLHFRNPIKSLDDVKGAKIRITSPEGVGVIKLFHGAVVGMPISEVAQSLSTGVLDGTMNSWGSLRAFRIESLNKKVYDGLPAKAKQALEKLGGEKLALRMGAVFDAQAASVKAAARKDPNRTIIGFSGAERGKRLETFKPLYDEWLKSTPEGASKMAALQKLL